MKFESKTGTLTTVAGSASATIYLFNTMLHQIIIVPTTSITSYDIKLTNLDSIDLIDQTDRVGTMNETVRIPVLGNYTLSIANASNDEQLTYYVSTEE